MHKRAMQVDLFQIYCFYMLLGTIRILQRSLRGLATEDLQ